MIIRFITLAVALIAMNEAALAQEQSSATIDGQTITVKFAQPGASKRVMASLQTPADIAFKGGKVPKGSYTVYVLTDGPQWQLAVNKATGAKAATYDAKLDLGRVKMTMGTPAAGPAAKVTLTKVAAMAAKLEVVWNGASASAAFHLDRGGADSEW